MVSSVKLSLTTKSWCPPPHPNLDPRTAPLRSHGSQPRFCESAHLPDHVTSLLASSPCRWQGRALISLLSPHLPPGMRPPPHQ